MRLRQFIAGIALIGTLPNAAAALTFSFTTKPGDTLSSSQATAFGTAANAWSATLSDNMTVNLQIGFASLSPGILGQTTPAILSYTASTIDGLLAADAKDTNDTMAVASLSTQTATSIDVTQAEAKALGASGLLAGVNDGTIEFSTNYTFSTQRSADESTPTGTYDLIGIAEHEIGHVLGFYSSIDGGTSDQTLLDQFRYSAANARSVTAGVSAYFSVNNGVADIAAFSVGGTGNYQASHWLQGTGALLDPAVATGVSKNITPLDAEALDVIGYDIPNPTPVAEPGSIALILAGLTALFWSRCAALRQRLRRRRGTPSLHRPRPARAERR